MLHLDVKGANVLLRFDGPPGTVFAKLADFGLTMRRKEVAGEDWARDRGTPRYM
jgi:serine/threonine protein kinase